MKEVCKVFCVNNKYFTDLLGSSFLFDILYTSHTVKTSKHMVNMDASNNLCDRQGELLLEKKKGEMYFETIFQMKVGYKVSCVKILMCS